MREYLQNWLLGQGLSNETTLYITAAVALFVVLILSVIANFVAKQDLPTQLRNHQQPGMMSC